MFQKLLWLAVAGAGGTVSRFALCELVGRCAVGRLPLGTLLVNVLGSFLFGLVYVLAESKISTSPEMRATLLVGFLGAFTTFSTFTFETVKLLQTTGWALALANAACQIILGAAALVAGVLIARMM